MANPLPEWFSALLDNYRLYCYLKSLRLLKYLAECYFMCKQLA